MQHASASFLPTLYRILGQRTATNIKHAASTRADAQRATKHPERDTHGTLRDFDFFRLPMVRAG